MSLVLHWFRSDLRLRDNTALANAARQGPVAGLFIATPDQWRAHDDAPVKIDFWRRNLQQLEQDLAARGMPLLFAEVPDYAAIPALLASILPALEVSELHCNREFAVNEDRRDQAVMEVCEDLGIGMQIHEDQTLFAPEDVLNKTGEPYKVFTPYSKAVRAMMEPATTRLRTMPAKQARPAFTAPAGCCALEAISWPGVESHWERYWPAGEDVAIRRLKHFTADLVQDYQEQRNFPVIDGTSKLSPHLTSGVLSVRQCWQASFGVEPGKGVHTWQNELIWHDFYKHVMWHFPHVSKHYNWREDFGHVPWRHDRDDFTRWCEGRTGIPIVDAAMRQLLATGWMHNRLRMITAMFLSKHLLLDWRWGEQWFMQHLVDGDFSANNGGWQWSASTGTDAAPYFRIFNPVTQSQRFDAGGDFIRHWVPELHHLDDKTIHDPGLLRPDDYPAPMIDLAFGRERALNAFKVRD